MSQEGLDSSRYTTYSARSLGQGGVLYSSGSRRRDRPSEGVVWHGWPRGMQINPWVGSHIWLSLVTIGEYVVPRWGCVLLWDHLALSFSCAKANHVHAGLVCQGLSARRSGVRDGITDGSG